MSIYNLGSGDELVNPANYDNEIDFYLSEEKKLILEFSKRFDVIIEAGCMTGRNCELVRALNKKYIGVDIVQRYIDEAISRYRDIENVLFKCNDIINLEKILFSLQISMIENSLVIFPFNSFGNILDGESTLKELLKLKINLAIFTYQNSEKANSVRKNYYEKSGFRNLKIRTSMNEVKFYNDKGLTSSAYNQNWFDLISKKINTQFSGISFSNIGVVYKNF